MSACDCNPCQIEQLQSQLNKALEKIKAAEILAVEGRRIIGIQDARIEEECQNYLHMTDSLSSSSKEISRLKTESEAWKDWYVKVKNENIALKGEAEALKVENERLKGEVDGWREITHGPGGAIATIKRLEGERDALKVENASLRGALEKISAPTYGTELCNSNAENNEILSRRFFIHQNIARDTLARSPSSFAEESKALRKLEEGARMVERRSISWDDKIVEALAELDRVRGGK